MKALILNSGLGSRMGILTSEHPKCMTTIVKEDTIVSRQLKQLSKFGISDIIMTTGLFDEVLKEYCIGLGLPININFVKNPIYRDTNYIYSIYCAKDYLDDDILLMHGDLVFDDYVLEKALLYDKSCMIVSSTIPLPQKDFKAVVHNEKIEKVGIEYFDFALTAQPLYKIKKNDWKIWLDNIVKYCENNNRKCYAENAFNEVSDMCKIYPLDIKNRLCAEIDNVNDLKKISDLLVNREVKKYGKKRR